MPRRNRLFYAEKLGKVKTVLWDDSRKGGKK